MTSAQHMPRAFYLFSQIGLKVIAAPSDFEAVEKPFSLNLLLPEAGALEGSTRAMKEYIGLWVMKVWE